MPMTPILSIDIGSTFTKGALFLLHQGELILLRQAKVPTTVHHLKTGFDQVRQQLDPARKAREIRWSSSAKGGLSIAAIGLVPDLTLKVAKLAALGAGGKVSAVFSYKLTRQDLEEILSQKPDILLLAGGTDGGNESYIRFNLQQLARLPKLAPSHLSFTLPIVLFAGNTALQEEVQTHLHPAGFEVRLAPNLMPQMDQIQPGGAQEGIRQTFLDKIVQGKGLEDLIRETGTQPLPTPLAVLKLVEAIQTHTTFGQFLLADLGGATTDIYSCGEHLEQNDRVILRGIKEPLIKRTVEGDLGMRISAHNAAEATRPGLSQRLKGPSQMEGFHQYLEHLTSQPEHLASSETELLYDQVLATSCLQEALLRHAGTWKRVFTSQGEALLQTGKNLKGFRKFVGSGGFLSTNPHFLPAIPIPENQESIPLLPESFTYYRDKHYLWPLLGNLAETHKAQSAELALTHLEEFKNEQKAH